MKLFRILAFFFLATMAAEGKVVSENLKVNPDSSSSFTGTYEMTAENYVAILHIRGPEYGYVEFLLVVNAADGCFAKKTGWAKLEGEVGYFEDQIKRCKLEFKFTPEGVHIRERGCYENRRQVSCSFEGLFQKK